MENVCFLTIKQYIYTIINNNKTTKIIKMNTTTTIIKSNRTFGVEVEFISTLPAQEIATKLNKKFRTITIENQTYNHTTQTCWKIVPDSSIHTSERFHFGMELVSPVLKGRKGLNDLKKVLNLLDSIEGTYVNKSCGIHVHVGVEDMTFDNVVNVTKLYTKQNDFIDCVLAPSRRREGSKGRRWARRITLGLANVTDVLQKLDSEAKLIKEVYSDLSTRDKVRKFGSTIGGRYKTVNLTAHCKYGTIEFRQHGGSLDSVKISNWIIFLTNLCDRAKACKKVYNTETTFVKTFGCSTNLLRYMSERAFHFGFTQYKFETVCPVVKTRVFHENCNLTSTLNKWTLNKLKNGEFTVTSNFNYVSLKDALKDIAEMMGVGFVGLTTRQIATRLFAL